MKHKSNTLSMFQQFTATVKNQFKHTIKILRSDCGGEFTSQPSDNFCAINGIIYQLSCPHTPQQNRVAERKHRHLVQCTLAVLSQSGLLTSHWSYALFTACHIINRLPTPLLNHKTPWEALFHKLAALSHLRISGCACFPLLTPYNSNKLQPKTKPCIFLGYPPFSKGYLCLDQSTNRIYTSRHVLFNESHFPTAKTSSYTPSDPISNLLPQISGYFHFCYIIAVLITHNLHLPLLPQILHYLYPLVHHLTHQTLPS